MDERTAPALPKEMNEQYEEAIRKNLMELMRQRGISQSQLAQILEQRGLALSQGNLSLILSGKKHFPLSLVVHLCGHFGVSLEELVDENFGSAREAAAPMPQVYSDELLHMIPNLGGSFITDPSSPEFQGYLQTYYFYMQPTLSYDTRMLQGTLTLEACGAVCEASLDLNTGRTAGGKPLHKHYRGRVFISKAIDAVYVLLASPVEGDFSILSFRHFHLPHQPLDCRIAAVLTNEAGEFHSPTMHRMFLSRTPIRPEHIPLLLPHLQLNGSAINIPKTNLERLARNEPAYATLLNALTMIPASETFYWTEDYVVGVAKHFLPKEEIPLFLTRIRECTVCRTSNKVSRTANTLIRNLLMSLGYYRDHDL